jgi:hypothetical protein
LCADDGCSDEELKLWLVVAFHYGSMCCVLSFKLLVGHSNIFKYMNI